MNRSTEPSLMKQAAVRVSALPEFLGYLLEAYKRDQKVSNEELATTLGCTLLDIYRLALCLAPTVSVGSEFRDYIAVVSAAIMVDHDHLAQVVRAGLNASKIQAAPFASPYQSARIALAARDHEDNEEKGDDGAINQADEEADDDAERRSS